MKTYRILVPTDFSSYSDAALDSAVSMAKGHAQAQILLLHVIEAIAPGYDNELGVLEPETLRTNMQMLAARREHHVPMETVVTHGEPSDKIIEVASQRDVDLIAMGTHGRTGIRHALFGSVAEYVMRHARCPVMTMREHQKDQAPLREPLVLPLPAPRFM